MFSLCFSPPVLFGNRWWIKYHTLLLRRMLRSLFLLLWWFVAFINILARYLWSHFGAMLKPPNKYFFCKPFGSPFFTHPTPRGSLAEMLPNSCIYCILNLWVWERKLWGCADDYSHHVVGLGMLDNGFDLYIYISQEIHYYPCWPMSLWKRTFVFGCTHHNSPAHRSCQTFKILNKSMVWLLINSFGDSSNLWFSLLVYFTFYVYLLHIV